MWELLLCCVLKFCFSFVYMVVVSFSIGRCYSVPASVECQFFFSSIRVETLFPSGERLQSRGVWRGDGGIFIFQKEWLPSREKGGGSKEVPLNVSMCSRLREWASAALVCRVHFAHQHAFAPIKKRQIHSRFFSSCSPLLSSYLARPS